MNDNGIRCLINSLNETQETIRAYDIKAEILALVITLAMGLLGQNFADNLKCSNWQIIVGIICVIFGIISMIFIGLVLYPSKEPFVKIDKSDFSPLRSYYINTHNSSSQLKVSSLVERVNKTDWQAELAFELIKCSCIRDRKHYWFVIALRFSALMLLLTGVFWVGMIGNV